MMTPPIPLQTTYALSLLLVFGSTLGCTRAPPRTARAPLDVRALMAEPSQQSSRQSSRRPSRQPIPLPSRGTVTIIGRTQSPVFAVEVADTEAERNQGLMFRTVLGRNKGMIFRMPRDYNWSFYMRNTRIPLDIIFVDSGWRVVGVSANAAPMTEMLRNVGLPSRYVFELDAHEAKRHGIRRGTTLKFVRNRRPN